MDLDTTIKGFELTPEKLTEIAKQLVQIPTEESFSFEFESVEEIRETDDYPGFKLKLIATFEKIKETVTIDVTTGDVITPKEIDFNFKKIFSDEKIALLSYPLETILAEKLETILSRGIGTTRPRDFYDVYILSKLKQEEINFATLLDALKNTKNKRKSVFEIQEYPIILEEIRNSTFQQELWRKYQQQYAYASDLTFEEVLDAVVEVLDNLEL